MKNFKKYKFIDCLSNIVDNRGRTCPTGKTGIPLIATNCIKNDSLYPVFENIRFVNEETYETWFRGHPEAGDMIFVTKGSPGRVCWVPKPVNFCIAQDMLAIRANEDIVVPKFLFALLRSEKVQHDIENLHVGSLIPHFKKGDFDQLFLNIPTDKILQRKIGDIYFSFCNKIELNRRMNQTLEQMAQALFNHYFVDNIDPDNLQDGWRESVFSEEFIVDKGLSYKGSGLCKKGEGKPMHNLNSVYEGGGYKYEGIKFYKGEHKDNHVVKPWDVIVANTEQGHKYLLIGYPSVIPASMPEGIFSHHIYRVRPKENSHLSSQFLYYLIMDSKVRGQIIGHTNGTTVNMLYKEGLQNPKFIMPTKDMIEKFSSVVVPIWKKKEILHLEVKSLTQIRDTLLPKLMSGEIDVDKIIDEEQLIENELADCKPA